MPESNTQIRKLIISPPDFQSLGGIEICRTRNPASLELFYNLISDQQGYSFPDHLRPIVYALADENIKRLLVTISPGASKSTLVSVLYPAWELGLDPTKTILGISSAEDQISKFLQATMQIIQSDKIYKTLYPNTIPDPSSGWSPFRGMYLKRRVKGSPDPSYSISGIQAQSLTGKHALILVGDDLHDLKNSSSPYNIDQLEHAFFTSVVGRQDPRGARILIIGRRWDLNDLYHRLAITNEFLVMTIPSIRDIADPSENPNLYFDVTIPEGLSCTFNDYKPKDYTEQVKVYYGYDPNGFYWPGQKAKEEEARLIRKTSPAVFQTLYQCQPELSELAVFKPDDFSYFTPPSDLVDGRTSDAVQRFLNQTSLVVQSWDTAFTAEKHNDSSVCYTAALLLCNQNHRVLPGEAPTAELHYDVYVLDEFRAKLEFSDLTEHAEELYKRWEPDKILVEKGATGIPLVQHLTQIAAPVEGISVNNVGKRQRATNGAKAGSAQGWMRSWRVKFPKDEPWIEDMEREFVKFTGTKGQQDDRVDALVQVINFAIDLGLTATEMPEGWRTDEEIDAQIRSWTKPTSTISHFVDSLQTYQNPFIGYCQTCKYFSQNHCNYHKITVSALHSCVNYESLDDVHQWQRLKIK